MITLTVGYPGRGMVYTPTARASFREAYREARKVVSFDRAMFHGGVSSLFYALDCNAVRAVCKYGDSLQFPHLLNGRRGLRPLRPRKIVGPVGVLP